MNVAISTFSGCLRIFRKSKLRATLERGRVGEGGREWGRGLALLVELVEDRCEQGRDHLEGVEHASARAGGRDDERARGVARGDADDLAG